MVGMPGQVDVDLTALWQREIKLVGAYAYGTETVAGRPPQLRPRLRARRTTPAWTGWSRAPTRSTATSSHRARRRRRTPGRRQDRLRPAPLQRRHAKPRRRRVSEPACPVPGFVLEVDRSTPPTLFWHGEGFRLEKLPVGRAGSSTRPSRSPPSPIPTRRSATPCCTPIGDSEPLPELLHAGMRLTIAFDDISLPLPPMRAPDVRQRVIEAVLDLAAAAGVDDVVLIAALALHRRMTDDELRHALGDRVFDAFAPHGLLSSTTPRIPTTSCTSGMTDQGEDVEINRRAAESDLLVYVNINLVAMDGGHKSVATGLASYRSLRHHHNVRDHAAQPVVHGPAPLRAALLELADGPADRRQRRQGLPDRDDAQHRHLPVAFGFLQKREWEWTVRDRADVPRPDQGARPDAADRLARSIFQSIRSPHAHHLGAGRRGRGGPRADHRRTCYRQQLVAVDGPDRRRSPWACPTSAPTTSTRS